MNKRPHVRLPLIAAALSGVLLSMVGLMQPAQAQIFPPLPPLPPGGTATVQLLGTGDLLYRGEAASVPVEVTCLPSPFPIPFPGMGSSVSVSLVQRWGNTLVQGSGSATTICDGTPHTVDVLVRPYERPFKQGDALATASTFSCGLFGCETATDTEQIRIGKSRS